MGWSRFWRELFPAKRELFAAWQGPFVALLFVALLPCGAQVSSTYLVSPTEPLIHGKLVVWVVEPLVQQLTADQVRGTLHTATAGSFGRAAGSVGQAAGSYGKDPSTLGNGVSSRAASDTGQAAGSFGRELSQLADPAGQPADPTAGFDAPTAGPDWTNLTNRLRSQFPDLKLTFAVASGRDLGDRLRAAASGAIAAPDVLISEGTWLDSREDLRGVALTELGTHEYEFPQENGGFRVRAWRVMARAPHPGEARAFVVWIRDGLQVRADRRTREQASVVEDMATAAVQTYLGGGGLGGAVDPAAASLAGAPAADAALRPLTRDALAGLRLRVDVLGVAANKRFAVVGLRVVAASEGAFGVLHPAVVLRHGEDGRWRVLHVSGNLAPRLLDETQADFQRDALAIASTGKETVSAVTQASPPDGDVRSDVPELWWDNPGQASLLVVEWQAGAGSSWGEAHLFPVPDRASRLQTRVSAAFLRDPSTYRWRVWSVGGGGLMTSSPWRRLTLVR